MPGRVSCRHADHTLKPLQRLWFHSDTGTCITAACALKQQHFMRVPRVRTERDKKPSCTPITPSPLPGVIMYLYLCFILVEQRSWSIAPWSAAFAETELIAASGCVQRFHAPVRSSVAVGCTYIWACDAATHACVIRQTLRCLTKGRRQWHQQQQQYYIQPRRPSSLKSL